MSENDTASHTLALLRRIDANVSRMMEDMHDIKIRLTNAEEGIAGVNRRLDRLDSRVERIEKRLELVEA